MLKLSNEDLNKICDLGSKNDMSISEMVTESLYSYSMKEIRLKLSDEAFSIISHLSFEMEISISQIVREVLKTYKSKGQEIDKKDTDDYSKKLYINPTEEVSKEEYYMYAEKITNQDIINILKELYEIKI